jgi:DNA-binding NtrC family response regulator
MPARAVRLLVVDDEQDTCANLSDIFSDLGFQVDVAYDGPSALELVERNSYDVAILDLKMPGMDGLELYRRIRKLSAGTVAIVVTAYASGNTTEAILDAGAWKILSKPVNFPHLMELVDEAIQQPLLLVVDDDQDLCDSLWEILRERGYRVCVAHDAPDAVAKLQSKNVQVLLVDMKLPTRDGNHVLSSLRDLNPDARSIVITGHRDQMASRVQDAMSNGANAVCYKPFDVAALLQTVFELCPTQAGKSAAAQSGS